ncbi:CapA family protein [Alkaliphilus peptidifermentans]|uniref:Poly-gamma-glutamate synthesis protein (Capsule biosynthesis protein) n=1 Tax=Alkaliphilus peptidifermentans DSM 18978 TaxID=1120976 RepID=A0A1G5J0D1_9FIRM|nr:CapA family protein [Alkaliphilus peptidifermentans]SCY81796.1 poly-gamma-glutamate synthesis protein (capsule biosynthesis protein) [Alkaliphilus peptidifermentans DSM 18978]
MKYLLLKGLLYIIGFFKGEKYKYSQEYEDNFKYMDIQEKIWWGYKSVVKQIENAEKDKGIEEYFANQDLNFKDDSFQINNTITITAGGDLSSSEMITPENTINLWDDVESFYFAADIVCANLESPIVPSKPAVGVPSMCLTAPKLNTTPEMFERFISGGRGVNFFATANNHSLDQGEKGIIDTLDFLDSKGYGHVGTARTKEEQWDIPVFDKDGIKVAFISYTYCLNGEDSIPGKEYMVNNLRLNKPDTDISLIQKHVKIARDKGADMVVAMLHWSLEFETYPIENIIKMGHSIMECGVDIIFGGHPHVVQPLEKYRFYDPIQKRHKEGLIVYSLGELVSLNLFTKNSRLAMLVKLELSEGFENNERVVKITELKVLPIYIFYRKENINESIYRVLDLKKTLQEIENGNNKHRFTEGDIKELKRLDRLFREKIMPRDSIEITCSYI